MERFGGLILRYRWIWFAVIVGLSVLFLLHVPKMDVEDDETTWYRPGDPTLEIFQAFEDRFEGDDLLFIGYEWDAPYSLESLTYLAYLTSRLDDDIPYISEVTSLTAVDDIVGSETAIEVRPLIDSAALPMVDEETLRHRIAINPFLRDNLVSEDGTAVALVLEIEVGDDITYEEAAAELVAAVRAVLAAESAATGIRFHIAGAQVTEIETERMLETDMSRFFPITMLFTAVLLLLFFRSIPSVILPLTTVFLSLGWTLGLKVLVGSQITPVSTTLFALITVIGVANSVHMISHYMLEKRASLSRREILLATYRHAGTPCLMTSLTTAVGFASLIVSRVPAIRQLGIFAAFGILSAFFLSMVIVPLGIDWISHRSRRTARNRWLEHVLERIGRFNLRHSRWVIVGSIVVAFSMAIGIFLIEPAGSMVEYFKPGSDYRMSVDFFDSRLAGASSTEVVLYGERDAFKAPDALQAIAGLQALAQRHEGVAAVHSIVDTVKLISRALHGDNPSQYIVPDSRTAVSQSLLLYEMSGGAGLREYVSGDYSVARVSIRTRQMRDAAQEALLADVQNYVTEQMPAFRAEITGMDHMVNTLNKNVILTQIQSFGLAIGMITVMMILVFGLRAGLLSLIPNVLPIVFVLGLMGYAGFGLNMATAIIASIAIGIVVDDTIHFFSHFRDELHKTGDSKLAMSAALTRVGKALCFTTLILVAGFGVFLFSDSWIMASYGILSGTAVLIALLGDLFVGPVLLARLSPFAVRRRN